MNAKPTDIDSGSAVPAQSESTGSTAGSGGRRRARSRPPLVPALLTVVIAVILLLIPQSASANYYQYTFVTAAALAIAALGFYLVYQVGGVTFGQAGFMAVGAYTSGLLAREFGWNVFAAMLVAILATLVLGVLIGILITRARSEFHFILVTFAFSEVVRLSLTRWVFGADGVPGIPSPELFGYSFRDPTRYYWLAVFALVLCGYLVWRLMHSGMGRMFLSVREGEQHLAPSFGIRPETYKVLAFAVASGLAGLAGALQAHFTNFVSPDQFGLQFSVLILTAAVIGGVGYISGPVIGAIVLVSLDRYLSEYPGTNIIVYGLVLVVVVLVMPGGLVGLATNARRLVEGVRRKKARSA